MRATLIDMTGAADEAERPQHRTARSNDIDAFSSENIILHLELTDRSKAE